MSGYLLIGEKLLNGQKEFASAWNFGPNFEDAIDVEKVVKILKKYWDEITYTIEAQKDFHEAKFLRLDCSKAYFQLQWKSVWNSKQTFKRTIKWYKNYYATKTIKSSKDLDLYIKDAKKIGLEWTN